MITVQQRQEAAARVSEQIDQLVRHESCYGEADSVGFDETMAYAAIGHLLATWLSEMPEHEMQQRLKTVILSTHVAWRDIQAGKIKRAG